MRPKCFTRTAKHVLYLEKGKLQIKHKVTTELEQLLEKIETYLTIAFLAFQKCF